MTRDEWPWLPYFSFDEMASRDENGVLHADMKPRFMHRVMVFREAWNRPMTVNSAFRTPWWNRKIGSSDTSYHPQGLAGDFSVVGEDVHEFLTLAHRVGFVGIGVYVNAAGEIRFVHLDMRRAPAAYWIGKC